jgi:general secretion pathway protein E
VGLFEILPVDEEMQRLIYEGAGAAGLRAHACSQGMRTLRADGLRKARAGLTTLAEVLTSTVGDPNSL